MILIADSGSTKTHWRALMPNGAEIDFFSQGLNPYHHRENFSDALNEAIADNVDRGGVTQVFFYGAGCAYQSMQDIVASNLRKIFCNVTTVEVTSDLMGAARSLFGNRQGIVVILGTGSNVGFYNGVELVRHTPSLGYILGDEGSGAHLGKEFVKRWLYNELPETLRNEIETLCPLSVEEILKRVYSSPSPAPFLAGFTDIIAKLSSHEGIAQLIDDCFVQLIEKHLLKYMELSVEPVGVVGSVGVVFAKELQNVLHRYGAQLDKVLQYPIDELISYHRTS